MQDGVVYFIDREISAVELPVKAGEEIACRERWYEELDGEFFASPLIHEGRVYAVDRAAKYYVHPSSLPFRFDALPLAPRSLASTN